MVKLAGALSHFKPIAALVVGDFMLDTYTTGRVKRISPEAPVPVMEVLKYETRPGGAGNVVLSLLALGAHVMAAGRLGDDAEGREIRVALESAGANANYLLVEERYRTPIKNRLIADSQQLLRVDRETLAPIGAAFETELLKKLAMLMERVQVVALSDYGKGLLTPRLIAGVIALAKDAGVPIIVDPKGVDFSKYRGATILKPNLAEAYAAAKMAPGESLEEVAEKIHQMAGIEYLLVTRSEAGISLFDRALQRMDFPVRSREVIDVTGAGDTVLAVVSAALANGLDLPTAIQLANMAAGIAIERLGCVQITLAELAGRLLEQDVDSKVFDDSHAFALSQVLRGKRYSLLLLSKLQQISNALLRALRALKKEGGEHLVVYVQGAQADDELIQLLSSLQEVNTIVLQSSSLKSICETLQPSGVYSFKQEALKDCRTELQTIH